jgi:glycosyltransferase involved in cell wall biosynthesis
MRTEALVEKGRVAGESLRQPTTAIPRESAPTSGYRHAEIGYVLMGFPRLSETFITHEIYLLERLGMKLRLFAIKHGDMDQVHDVVGQIRAPLTYLPSVSSLSGTNIFAWLWHNFPVYAQHHRKLFNARPLAYIKTLGVVLAMAVKYRKAWTAPLRKVFIKEFLQAGHIAMQVIESPGIRHLHGHFCHGATTITWLVSRLTGIPFSFTAHAKDIYQVDQNPGDLLARKLNASRFVTTCTGANATHLAQQFPSCDHVHTVYHGLDTSYFAPPLLAQRANMLPRILAVGRFVEKKGFADLIDACAILKTAGVGFRALLIGENGDQLETIRNKIREFALEDVISLQGPVTHDELRCVYHESAIFALPCLVAADGDRDGIPNVLAEAMATGLAVVTTAVSGIPELVRDNIDGLMVPERNPQALAAALRQLLQDEALRLSLGTAARHRVCEIFDSHKTTVQLKALFRDAMNLEEVSG